MSDGVTLKKEILEISPDLIRARYELKNESKTSIETEVSFPATAADASVKVDGKKKESSAWKQVFPPGKVVRIEQTYKPGFGNDGQGQLTDLDSWASLAEPEWNERAEALIGGENDQKWSATSLSVDFAATRPWKTAAENFELKITGAPAILVQVGERRDVDLDSFVWKKKSFRPEGELLIQFIRHRPLASKTAKPVAPSAGELGLTKRIRGPANCRDEPENKAPIARVHEDGVAVRLISRQGDWYRVSPGCWTYGAFLKSRIE